MSSAYCIGIDEVGRGAWAGPVVIAAVFLNRSIRIPDSVYIRDSKVLNRASRAHSDAFLRKNSTFCISIVSAGTVDKLGVHFAIAQGIQKVACKIKKKIISEQGITEDEYYRRYKVLVDGRRVCDIDGNHQFIIKGDSIVPIISAASIIAKEHRDQYMRRISMKYPEYGFEKHVGYGTKEHQRALAKHGICTIHRRSYAPIKKLLRNIR